MNTNKLFLQDPSDEGFELKRGKASGPDEDVVVCKLLVTQELYFVLPENTGFLEVLQCDTKPAQVNAVAKVQTGLKVTDAPLEVDYHVVPSVNDLNMGRSATISYMAVSKDNLMDDEYIPTTTEEDVALIHFSRKREREASQRLKDKRSYAEDDDDDDDLLYDSDGRVHLKGQYDSEESEVPVKKRRGRPPKVHPKCSAESGLFSPVLGEKKQKSTSGTKHTGI